MIRYIFHFVSITTTLLSLVVSFSPPMQVAPGYDYLWIHPLAFLFIYIIIFIRLINAGRYKVTLFSFIYLTWIRYVLIPFCSSLTGIYNGVSYIYVEAESVQSAILLVAYELIITSTFLLVMIAINKRKSNGLSKESPTSLHLFLKGNKYIYALFIIIAIALYLTIGRSANLIQFFVISTGTGERQGDLDSTFLVLIRQIITTSLIFIFVWFVSYCKKKHDLSGKVIYVNLAIVLGIINVGIIVGERRSVQLYTAFVVIFILIHAFRNYKRRVISVISGFAVMVILAMSVYKHFAAFAYGSYSAAISSSEFDLEFLTRTLQSYYFGTQNVAVTLEMGKYEALNIINMFYDFGRSFFGLSFFFKEKMLLTSEIFNSFIYGQTTATGHLLSGIGYGYLYFGTLLAPIIVCFNIFISIQLEKWFNNTTSFEMKYIAGYILIRFSTNIVDSTPPLINLATIMLFTAGLLYFVALIFRRKKHIRSLQNVVPSTRHF